MDSVIHLEYGISCLSELFPKSVCGLKSNNIFSVYKENHVEQMNWVISMQRNVYILFTLFLLVPYIFLLVPYHDLLHFSGFWIFWTSGTWILQGRVLDHWWIMTPLPLTTAPAINHDGIMIINYFQAFAGIFSGICKHHSVFEIP